MQAPFGDLRVPGELRCGGAHKYPHCANALLRVAIRRHTAGEESPLGGSGQKARRVPGRKTRVNTNANYSSLSDWIF